MSAFVTNGVLRIRHGATVLAELHVGKENRERAWIYANNFLMHNHVAGDDVTAWQLRQVQAETIIAGVRAMLSAPDTAEAV